MVAVSHIKRGQGWLTTGLPEGEFKPARRADEDIIDTRSSLTNQTGAHPLWDGYSQVPRYKAKGVAVRKSNEVRTSSDYGRLYAWLVETLPARSVVEFGTAFGVSGMFWLSGLARTGGHLFTFEPNAIWASFAKENLASISSAFTLTNGTFEENAAHVLQEGSIDVGFIDAIHTSAFVFAQFAILKRYVRPGGIVLFDDIAFSDDMRSCWQTIAGSDDIQASAELGKRVGIVELPA